MKLIKNIISLFLLFSSSHLLAADQKSETIQDALVENAYKEADRAHLEGLLKASSMIRDIQVKLFCPGRYDVQYLSQTRCQYNASCAFEKILGETMGKIHDPALQAELVVIAAEVKKIHQTHDPYAREAVVLWPEAVETCMKNSDKYNNLLSSTHAKIGRLAEQYRVKELSEKNKLIDFITSLIRKGHLGEELARDVENIGQQRDAVLADLTTLGSKKDNLVEQHRSLDFQIAHLKEALTVHDVAMTKWKSEQAALIKEMDEKKSAHEARMAELEAVQAHKTNEVRYFRVALPGLIREVFWQHPKDRVVIKGILQGGDLYPKLKAELTKLVERLESKFEKSQDGLSMADEKTALHQLIFQIENVQVSTEGLKRPKKFLTGTISAKVSNWNIVKSASPHPLSFRYYDVGAEGFLRDKNGELVKNDELVAVIETVISQDLPLLKKAVYDEANSIKNQRMLWGWIGSMLEKYPCSSLSCDEDGALAQALHREHRDDAGASADEGVNNRYCMMCGFEEPPYRRAAPKEPGAP